VKKNGVVVFGAFVWGISDQAAQACVVKLSSETIWCSMPRPSPTSLEKWSPKTVAMDPSRRHDPGTVSIDICGSPMAGSISIAAGPRGALANPDIIELLTGSES